MVCQPIQTAETKTQGILYSEGRCYTSFKYLWLMITFSLIFFHFHEPMLIFWAYQHGLGGGTCRKHPLKLICSFITQLLCDLPLLLIHYTLLMLQWFSVFSVSPAEM